jgi:hypothetical protein
MPGPLELHPVGRADPADALSIHRHYRAVDDARRARWDGLTEAERAAVMSLVVRENPRPDSILARHWGAFQFRFVLELMDVPESELAARLEASGGKGGDGA